MRFAFFQATSRVHHVPAAIPAIKSVSTANPKPRRMMPSPSHPFEKSQEAAGKVCQERTTQYAYTATASAEGAYRF